MVHHLHCHSVHLPGQYQPAMYHWAQWWALVWSQYQAPSTGGNMPIWNKFLDFNAHTDKWLCFDCLWQRGMIVPCQLLISLYYVFCCVWNPQTSLHPPLLSPNLWYSVIFWAFHPWHVTIFAKTRSCLREHFSALWGRYGLWWSVVGNNGAALPTAAPTSQDLQLSRVPAGETRLTGSASIAARWEKAILTKALFIVLFTKS